MRNDYTRVLIYNKITVCRSDCKFHTGQESRDIVSWCNPIYHNYIIIHMTYTVAKNAAENKKNTFTCSILTQPPQNVK